MAEPRRVNLISTALPVEKKTEPKSSSDCEGVIFAAVSFAVAQPSDTVGPTYDFEKLLADKKLTEDSKAPSKEDPFGEEEEEAKAIKLAKHFEEKYGTSGPRDLRELGSGYDHNDPFVDDAQSAESVIPPGWTTQHGGFYIGTGPLYIRPCRSGEEKSHIYQSATVDECLIACKNLSALTLKRKRVVESSDEEDSEDSRQNRIKRKKIPVVAKTNEKRSTESESTPTKKAVPKTVASMLAQRADPFESSEESSVDAEEAPTDLRKPKDFAATTQTGSDIKSAIRKTDRDVKSDSGDGPMQPIPEEIPESLREVIDDLKKLAVTWDGGKCNFFSPEHNPVINSLLLRLEYECRQFRCGLRSAIFGHVAGNLPCTKETLVKRARKLRQDDVDNKFADLLLKLGRVIQDDTNGGMDPVSRVLKSAIKKLLVEGVRLKMAVYDLHKQRFATHEDYIRNFVDTELTPLWKNHRIEKENIYCEALLALGEALRPTSLTPKLTRPAVSKEDYDMPPAISTPLLHQNRDSSHSSVARASKGSLPVRPAFDIMTVARSGAKVLHTTKSEVRKESAKHGSGLRKSSSDSTKSTHLSDVKAVFLPDLNGGKQSNFKKSSSLGKHGDAHTSRAFNPSANSQTNKPSALKSSLGSMDRPSSSSSRPSSSLSKEKSRRSEISSQDGDARAQNRRSSALPHGKTDRHSAHSPKILSHQTHSISSADRPSSRSSVGSTSKNSSSSHKHSLSRGGGADFDQTNNFSVSSLTSPFVHPYNLPLMAGFSPDNIFMGMPGAASYVSGVFPEGLAALFNSGVYNAAGSSFARPTTSSPPKVSPSQSDSPFTPR